MQEIKASGQIKKNKQTTQPFHMLFQTMAITYLETTANTEITFKVSAVSLAQASTNIQPAQCLGKLLTLGWYPKTHPNSAEPTGWTDYRGKTCHSKRALP